MERVLWFEILVKFESVRKGALNVIIYRRNEVVSKVLMWLVSLVVSIEQDMFVSSPCVVMSLVSIHGGYDGFLSCFSIWAECITKPKWLFSFFLCCEITQRAQLEYKYICFTLVFLSLTTRHHRNHATQFRYTNECIQVFNPCPSSTPYRNTTKTTQSLLYFSSLFGSPSTRHKVTLFLSCVWDRSKTNNKPR